MTQARPITVHGKPVSGGAVPLICTPLVGRTREAVLAEVAAVLPKRPDLIEWRVDFFAGIGDTAMVIDTARAIKSAAGETPILFTRRSTREGGEPTALHEVDVVRLYLAVCEQRCVDLIDWELSSAAEDLARLRGASRELDIAMVMSYHDFQATPDRATLVGKFSRAAELGADVAKVATMPKGPEDVLELLGATHEAHRSLSIPLISMSMGGLGALSRMIGWVYGSSVTFAVGKGSSAPGQVPIEELRTVLASVRRAVTGG